VPTEIAAVLQDVLAQARQLPDAQRIDLRDDGRCEAGQVAIDYLLIKQAFLNIIQNAFDAMPQGGSLAVSCAHAAGSVNVSFSDTGGGIDPSVAARIMQPFFTTRHRGTGLGLPIAQSIVEAHGGGIRFQSEPGRGTTFTVSLPLAGRSEESQA